MIATLELINAALGYIGRGWKVFPLHAIAASGACTCGGPCDKNAGKHPRTARGFKDATADLGQVQRWWRAHPEANIGLATGEASGFWVLDIDPAKGGTTSLEQLEFEHGMIDAPTVQTGGGGLHFYFKHPAGLKLGNRTDSPLPGIDVRATGGYVVAPPSSHRSGQAYAWRMDGEPPEAPGWLLALLTAAKPELAPREPTEIKNPRAYGASALRRAVESIRVAPEGRRNDTLNREVHGLARLVTAGALQREKVETEAQLAGEAAGLTADETRKTIASALGDAREPAVHAAERDPVAELDADAAWLRRLNYTKDGGIRSGQHNATVIAQHDPAIVRSLVFDVLHARATLLSAPPWDAPASEYPRPLADDDVNRCVSYLVSRYGVQFANDHLFRALDTSARDRAHDPIRGYLEGLSWDGRPRIDTWLVQYLGAKDEQINRLYGAKWLISAVARALQPGCQVDHTLILEGIQGLRKSSALRALADPWFSEEPLDLHSKDGQIANGGVWIRELGELAGMSKGDVETLKAYLTRRVDRFRPPYGRTSVEIQRRVVFSASTNEDAYLRDSTGGRRFWPVRCSAVDIEGIRRDRDQLWAEATRRYRARETWWLETPEATKLAQATQESRAVVDPWESIIAPYAETRDFVTVEWALDLIDERYKRWTRADANRVVDVFRSLGFTEKARDGSGARPWGWKRPSSAYMGQTG